MLSEGSVQSKVGEFCPQMDIQSYDKDCVLKKGEYLGFWPYCDPRDNALSPLSFSCFPASATCGH